MLLQALRPCSDSALRRAFLLFFGGKKVPELMKGLGKGVKSFKDGMNGTDDSRKEKEGQSETVAGKREESTDNNG